ncbi:MAG: ribonuclease [Eubacterium sp.]|nr:ribonuclease [Eubacterium sp.]
MKHLRGNIRRFAGLLLAVLLLVGLIPLAGCGSGKDAAGTQSAAVSVSNSTAETAGGDADESTAVSESGFQSESSSEAQSEPEQGTPEDADSRSLDVFEEDAQDTAAVSEEADESVVLSEPEDTAGTEIDEHGSYTSKEEVALYLHTYGHLPENYITKKQAEKLGWDNRAGNLQDVAPGKSIGGSRFGNYEGLLPDAKGRNYYECDINYEGGYRGAERIIYSDDGLIFYTADHYKSFEQLY